MIFFKKKWNKLSLPELKLFYHYILPCIISKIVMTFLINSIVLICIKWYKKIGRFRCKTSPDVNVCSRCNVLENCNENWTWDHLKSFNGCLLVKPPGGAVLEVEQMFSFGDVIKVLFTPTLLKTMLGPMEIRTECFMICFFVFI